MLITDYLDQLDIDKDTLYNNLVNAGISASQDETFTTLCPKVGELTSDIKAEFKPSINITGVNITDEPLSEYPDKLNEGLINVLNNGTDVIFNNYPNKETKEGSSQIFTDCVNAKMKIQEKGYLLQYGGTPTPSNEVPIYTVTGDNYIEISNVDTPSQRVDYFLHLGVENLYNANKLIPGYLPNSGAYPTTSESWPNSKYLTFELKANQVLYIKNVNDVNNVASLKCIDKTTNEVVTYIDTQENNYFTSTRNFSSGFNEAGTITAKVDFIVGLNIKDPSLTFSVDMVINNQYMSENPIELCKIPNTDYQDTFIRSNGKNLFDNITTNQVIGIDGTVNNNDSWNLGSYILVKPNTKYTFSRYDGNGQSLMIVEYTSDKTFIKRDVQGGLSTNAPYTITTSNNTFYVRLNYNNTKNITKLQFEKGSTTAYEPYGNGIWYVYKEVGKVVLNGSGNTELYGNGGTDTNYWEYFRTGMIGGDGISDRVFTNYFDQSDYSRVVIISNGTLYLRFPKSVGIDVSTNTLLNNWLSTHNTVVYYVLANPTYTKITDTNLTNELEQVYSEAKSYAGRTQVTAGIIGNSAPMILETTVLKEMN